MRPQILLLIGVILAVPACSCSNSSKPGDFVMVEGLVTEIEDQTPVDGGVTIVLRLETGASERLYFGSLFTSPPPDQKRLDLYEKIRTMHVGDTIRAFGRRVDDGIELSEFLFLDH